MARTPAAFDPFRDMVSLRGEMDRIFDSMLGRFPRERDEAVWAPLVDIEETEDSIVVRVDLPGMRREDIKLSVTGDTLTLTGERKREVTEKTKAYHHVERATGRFIRTMTLPSDVEPEKAQATFKSGVLELVLPKSSKAQTREIAIESRE